MKPVIQFITLANIALIASLAYVTAIALPNDKFVSGFYTRPFVYRVLPNATLDLLIGLTTPEIAIAVQSAVSMIGFALAMGLLVSRWSKSWHAFAVAALSPVAVLVLYALSPHPYDLPILFVFTLGLGLLAHERMWAYLMVFLVACLTKETAIFLTVIYAANMAGSSLKEQSRYRTVIAGDAAWWLFAQLGIYGLTRVALWIAFRDWRGGRVWVCFLR